MVRRKFQPAPRGEEKGGRGGRREESGRGAGEEGAGGGTVGGRGVWTGPVSSPDLALKWPELLEQQGELLLLKDPVLVEEQELRPGQIEVDLHHQLHAVV